jgi:hypothetical protein
MRRIFLVVAFALAVHAVACRRVSREQLNQHVVRTPAYWGAFVKKPLVDRVRLQAPPEVIDYLIQDNQLQGYPDKPRVATLSPDFAAEIRQAVVELPPRLVELVADKLVAITFVNDLGGSAYTENLADQGHSGACFLVLDVGVLDRPANEWASWKESTPFAPDPAMSIVATIGPPDQNTRRLSVEMLLIHELAHLVGLGKEMHPKWHLPPQKVAADYPFFVLSWDVRGDQTVSLFDEVFPARVNVHYYSMPGDKLPMANAPSIYSALEKTNLPTLYGAQNPLDDFAESLATYVHTQMLKRPWQIQILRDNQPVKTYRACWDEPRCREKRAILDRLMGR